MSLSTVRVLRSFWALFQLTVFFAFSLLYGAISHSDLSVFPGFTAVLGFPMISEHWTSGTRSPPAARRESIAFLDGSVMDVPVQTVSHRFGSI